MKTTLAIAALIMGSSAVRINERFAEGVEDVDEIDIPNQAEYAMIAAKEGSGVRARWIELPDCGVNVTAADVPLKDDLSNAIIATCKSHAWVVAKAKANKDPVYAFGEDDDRMKELGW